MRLRSFIAALALCGAAAAPALASAATVAVAAYDGTSNMRAGPGTNYPVIARILAGSRVNVVGCLSNFSWCDVIVQNYRGWVSTTRLEFAYAGRRQTPVIGFGYEYWDRHYTNWPWYREWRRQNHHRPNWDRPDWDRPDWDRPDWNRPDWDGRPPDLQTDRPTPVYPDPQPTDVPDQVYPDQGGPDVVYPDQGGPEVIYPDQGGGGWDVGTDIIMPDGQMGACPPSDAACQ